MNRRDFIAFLGLAPIAAPLALKAAPVTAGVDIQAEGAVAGLPVLAPGMSISFALPGSKDPGTVLAQIESERTLYARLGLTPRPEDLAQLRPHVQLDPASPSRDAAEEASS